MDVIETNPEVLEQTEQRNNHFCLPENDYPKIVVIGACFAGIDFIKNLDGKPVQLLLIDRHN